MAFTLLVMRMMSFEIKSLKLTHPQSQKLTPVDETLIPSKQPQSTEKVFSPAANQTPRQSKPDANNFSWEKLKASIKLLGMDKQIIEKSILKSSFQEKSWILAVEESLFPLITSSMTERIEKNIHALIAHRPKIQIIKQSVTAPINEQPLISNPKKDNTPVVQETSSPLSQSDHKPHKPSSQLNTLLKDLDLSISE